MISFGTQSFMQVTTQKLSSKYVLQSKSYNKMDSNNTTDVIPLCYTWKNCICFGAPLNISSVGKDFSLTIQLHVFSLVMVLALVILC